MGPLGWILALMAANGAVLAGLIIGARGNRGANRALAALIVVIAIRSVVYVLGFAGAYDAAPWLTFLPLDASLALGPLLWIYVDALTRGALPDRWRLHLVPAAIQLLYFAFAFLLPLDRKWAWYAGPHLRLVEPAGLLLVMISCSSYLTAAFRRQRDYQSWLDDTFGNREQWRLGWLTTLLFAFATTLVLVAAAAVLSWTVGGSDYFQRAPVVIATSLLAYALGLLGWRHADGGFPSEPKSRDVAAESSTGPDPKARSSFEAWTVTVRRQGWWREIDMTAPNLARRLAVSERVLSRRLRDGGGCNFNAFINAFRVEAVIAALEAGYAGDLLTLALDSGFNSKASFNRAFRSHTGRSPSEWRAAQDPPIALRTECEATFRSA